MAVPGDAAQGHPVLVTAASCIFTILIYVVLSPGISALWAKLRGQRPEVNFFAVADAKALRLPVDEIPAEAEKAADPPSEAQECKRPDHEARRVCLSRERSASGRS